MSAAISVTIFDDLHARTRQEYNWDIEGLVNKLREPKTYPRKQDCRLLKLATFGELRAPITDCLRHDKNMLQIFGVEGDYDAESMSLADAQMMLSENGVSSILYTSPSHTGAKPRWRVLAPLSKPYPPSERRRFVAMLNGCLGGVLAKESFVPSQSYYCGRVEGKPYEVAQIRGKCIDEISGLAEVYPAKKAKAANNEARAEAILEGGRNAHLTSLAGSMRRRGMGVDAILAALMIENKSRCKPPLGDDEVRKIALGSGRYAPEGEPTEGEPTEGDEPRFTRNRHGQIKATLGNIVRALQQPSHCGWHLARDVFRDEIMKKPFSTTGLGAWERFVDDDYTAMRQRLEEMRDPFMPIGLEMARHCVSLVALNNKFDSALQWLNAIKWDGVSRVELSLTKYFGASDTPYVRAVGQYIWTALAGRLLSPGVQADMVPVGVGDQGLKKSRTIAAIAPYVDYAGEADLSVDDDDLVRLMRGRVIAELAELQGLRNRELEHVKAVISRSEDRWIPKYKELASSYRRRGIFFGSTNEDEFLSDQTGNRRWLPFTCGVCDPIAMAEDRDQLWAEGAALFKANGIAWQGAERLGRFEHDQFMVSDPWDSRLWHWLGLGGRDVDMPFTVADALEYGLGLDMAHVKPADQMRAVKILKRFRYRTSAHPETIKGKRARFWRKKT